MSEGSFADFLKERARARQSEEEKLEEKGGFLHESGTDGKSTVNVFGTKLATDIKDPQEVEAIAKSLNVSELDEMMFSRLAKAYKLGHAIMFEGDPGAGKTFTFSKFHEFLHGKDTKPLVITCTPKMSELELIGHWVPAPGGREKATGSAKQAYEEYDAAEATYTAELDKHQAAVRRAIENKTNVEAITKLGNEYVLARERYKASLEKVRLEAGNEASWTFKNGFLPEVYTGNGGKGRFGVVDEFGLLTSQVQQIFLQAVAERGKISDHIQAVSNGKEGYARGEDGYLCFATNLPENTSGRNVVSAPMTDRLEWVAIPSDLVRQKEADIIKTWNTALSLEKKTNSQGQAIRMAGGLRHEPGEQFELKTACNGDVVKIFGDRLALFHNEYKNLIAGSPDKFKNEERIQSLEASVRRALHVMNHINEFQIIGDDGMVDLEATFREAVIKQYADRLFDKETRDKAIALLDTFLVEASTGTVNFRGKDMTAREALTVLKEEYAKAQYAAESGKTLEQITEEYEKEKAEATFEEDQKQLGEFEEHLDRVIAAAEKNYKLHCTV